MTTDCRACRAFDVLGWLDERGVKLRPAPAYILRWLFEHPECASVKEWAAGVRVPTSTLRSRMTKKSLPHPKAWLAVVHSLHTAGLLRADPDRTLAQVGFSLGHADHTTALYQLRRSFGVSASEIRAGLSDRELMDRWWSAHEQRRTAA